MKVEQDVSSSGIAQESVLQAYLLGTVEFEAALDFQRRMHYEISGAGKQAALILCEHPPTITVGRQGSRAHILCEPDELANREWQVRWVNRGGGCLLHLPGQLAIYSMVPLQPFGLDLRTYRERLETVVQNVLRDFSVESETRPEYPGIWCGRRLVAGVGIAVRNWVSYFGAYLNVSPDLPPFRLVRWGDANAEPMTSLIRERRSPLRMSLIRERIVEHFANCFDCSRTALFSEHPALKGCVERYRPAPAPAS